MFGVGAAWGEAGHAPKAKDDDCGVGKKNAAGGSPAKAGGAFELFSAGAWGVAAGTNMSGGRPAVDLGPLDALLPSDEGCAEGMYIAGPAGRALAVIAGGATGMNIDGPCRSGPAEAACEGVGVQVCAWPAVYG